MDFNIDQFPPLFEAMKELILNKDVEDGKFFTWKHNMWLEQ